MTTLRTLNKNLASIWIISRYWAWAVGAGLLLMACLACPATAREEAPDEALLTVAESSDFQSTSRYEDVISLARELDRRSNVVHLTYFGKSHEGRDLPLLIIADPPMETAEQVRGSSKIKVLVVGNIHAGEVCGKEALMMLARDYALKAAPQGLQDLVLLFAPILNADGNEKVSRDNRPGQNGPANGMGQRENALGLDLNRDHTKLESAEIRAIVGVLREYDPDIWVDTHTTNGSQHAYTITYDGPRHPATPEPLVKYTRDEFLPEVGRRLEQRLGYRAFFYGNFNEQKDRWDTYPAWPRYSVQYAGLRGVMGILSEAYAYASFRDRVLATKGFLEEIFQLASEKRSEIREMLQASRELAARPAREDESLEVAVACEATACPEPVRILGYDVTTVDANGTQPSSSDTPLRDYPVTYYGQTRATRSVIKPFAYLVPEKWKQVADNLSRHGIELEVLREDLQLDVQAYLIHEWSAAHEAFQGHRLISARALPETVSRKIPQGTIVARTQQRLAPLLIQLLEPESEDGLVAWNFFDSWRRTADPGDPFPVLRLMTEQPLLTAKRDDIEEPSAAKRPQPLKLEMLHGKTALNLEGTPANNLEWYPDGEHYLRVHGDQYWKVHADTGRASLVLNPEEIAPALAKVAGVDEKKARKLLAPHRRFHAPDAIVFRPDFSACVVTVHQDLFYIALEELQVRRLTDSAAVEELLSFSPDGTHVAFVQDFALWTVAVRDGRSRRLSPRGHRALRFGKADWVYFEEVYNRTWRSYHWSPDSNYIAFMEFDDHPVAEFTVLQHLHPRGEVEREHYPKAGDPIPRVRVGVVSVHGGPIQWLRLDGYSADNCIVTRYGWLPDSRRLFVLIQDRAQKWLDYCHADGDTGTLQRLWRERAQTWVGDPDAPIYLQDGSWLLCSERDGWRHIYHFRGDGTLHRQVTSGAWEVRSLAGFDEDQGWIYFVGTRDSHVAENVYRVQLDGSHLTRLTPEPGHHQARFAPQGGRFVQTYSTLAAPPRVLLRGGDGSLIRGLDTNPVPDLHRCLLAPVELFEIPLSSGYSMPCTMIRPRDFDPTRKYPVWIMTYGGPHAPTVNSSWGRGRAFEQLLAASGIVAFRCDPQSASGRGAVSTRLAYEQLGVTETRDLEAAAEWLASQDFVDAQRIGLSGHSYGGYLTAYVLTHSKKFAAGVAGAPVTDWRNYDAFYTERYMNVPQENPDGYRRSSVVEAAKDLHGRLLLIHGSADDNVHVQNTFQLAHALQEHDRSFELMIYPTSRHGIFGMHYQRLVYDFILRTMRPEEGQGSHATCERCRPDAD